MQETSNLVSPVQKQIPSTLFSPSLVSKSSELEDYLTTVGNLESRLSTLVLEKSRVDGEYIRVPTSGGNAVIRRKRMDLERRLEVLDKEIVGTRRRLKEFKL